MTARHDAKSFAPDMAGSVRIGHTCVYKADRFSSRGQVHQRKFVAEYDKASSDKCNFHNDVDAGAGLSAHGFPNFTACDSVCL